MDEFKWQTDKWADIADLVKRWRRRNPEGYRTNLLYVKEKKAGLKDAKFGLLGGPGKSNVVQGGTRIGLAIHPELLNYIENFYPDFLSSNEDVQIFAKKFPAFAIPEKF